MALGKADTGDLRASKVNLKMACSHQRDILFPLFILSCLIFSGCGKLNLFSSWRDREIIIDGRYSDWGESTTYYDEKAKVVLNLANDADYMYVCLVSRNREIEKQMLESGFVAWFDRDGGENKVFGIRFPMGGISLEEDKRDMAKDWQDQEDKSGLIDREKERLRDMDFNKHLETLEGLQERLEIIEGAGNLKNKNRHLRPHQKELAKGDMKKKKADYPGDFPKDKPMELSLDEAGKLGIEAKVGRENDYFVYELKVPLKKSVKYPHAIGITPGKPIGLRLEIPVFNPDSMGRFGRRAPAGEGSGEHMHPGNNFQLWATVMLSSRPFQ
jgi:hypothetical protein